MFAALGLAAGALFLVAVGAGFWPSALWQILLGLLAFSTVLYVGARARYALRPRSEQKLLAELAEDGPAQRALLALAELDAQAGRSDRGMVRLFRRRVVGLLDGESPSAWLPAHGVRRSVGLVAIVALAWAVGVWRARAYLSAGLTDLVTAADDRALPSKTPLLRVLTLEIEPPAYTGAPRQPLGDSTGNLRALAGSKLHLHAQPREAADRARVVWGPPAGPSHRLSLVRDQAGGFAGTLSVEAATTYHFEVHRDGVWWKETVERRIELEVDQAPKVELKAASDALELETARPIELGYLTEDDYGLSELMLEWQPEGGAINRQVLEKPQAKQAQGKFEWDLREMKMPSGKRISYWLTAKDNNTVNGPGVGKSRILTLSLRTAKQDHDRTVSQQKELLEAALKLLAERLERPTDVIENARALHGGLPNFVSAVQHALEALDKDRGARRDLSKKLGDLAERIGKLASEEDKLLASASPKRDKLAPLAAKIVTELEDDVLLLEALVGRERLEEMAAITQQIKQTKEQIKQLLTDYKNAPSEEKKRAIERQLAELEKRLAELQRKASEAMQELPEEFVNREALESKMMETQVEKIRRLMAEGKIDEAMKEMEKLSSQIDQMASEMDKESDGLRNERFGAEEKRLAELESALSELGQEESEIRAQTNELRDEMRKRMEEKLQQKQAELKKIADDVTRLKKMLDETQAAPLPPQVHDELDRSREEAGQLERAMKPLDLEEALQKVQGLRNDLRAIKRDLDEPVLQMLRGDPAGAKKSTQKLGEAEGLAESIQKRLSEIAPKQSEMTTPQDRERMQNLDKRQQANRKRLEQLQKKAGQPPGENGEGGEPIPGMDQSLGEAGRHMQGAEGQLRGGKPREALGEESQALEALQKAQQQVQRERRPDPSEGRGRQSSEPVKIPGADDYHAPREFREDILDAMKRASPERYKQQIEKYFQELVR